MTRGRGAQGQLSALEQHIASAPPLERAMIIAALAYASGRRVLVEAGELRLINGLRELACPEIEATWERWGDRVVAMALGCGVPIVLGHRSRACAAGWLHGREVPS